MATSISPSTSDFDETGLLDGLDESLLRLPRLTELLSTLQAGFDQLERSR